MEIKNFFKSIIGNKLVSNTFIVLIGNLVTQGLNFLTVLILARFFGKSIISFYSVTISLLTLLLAISDSGIGNAVVKFLNYFKGNIDRMNAILKVGLFFRVITGIIITFSGLFGAGILSLDFYQNKQLYTPFLIAFVSVVILTLHSFIAIKMQAEERFSERSIFLSLTAVLRFCFVIFCVILIPKQMNLSTSVLIYVLSPLFLVFIYSKQITSIIGVKVKIAVFLETSKELFHYSKWMFFSMVAVLLIMRIDQFMLLKISSPEETSIYVIATQIAMILPLLGDSLTTVILPRITQKGVPLQDYRKNVLKKLGLFCVVILIFMEMISPILPVLFGREYQASTLVLRILILAFIVGIILNPLSLIFYQKSRVYYLTLMNYIQLFLMVIFNLLFIPMLGAVGAAISALLVRVFSLLYVLVISNKIIKQGES